MSTEQQPQVESVPPPPPPPPPPAAAAAGSDGSTRKRSRWGGPAEATPNDSSTATAAAATPTAAASAGTPTAAATTASSATGGAAAATGGEQPAKKRRWGEKPAAPAVPPGGMTLPGGFPLAGFPAGMLGAGAGALITQDQIESLKLKIRIDELNRKLMNPLADLPPPEARSPSPEPQYNERGIRTNTREVRVRAKLTAERDKLVEAAIRLNPAMALGASVNKIKKKPEARMEIPIKKFPNYNFIGLIIGPRGNTQKRMEKETGCKISIRGKGSVKEGKTRKSEALKGDENDPLHVLVQGDTQEQVDRAAEMVAQLLVPVDESKNEHKAKQLRELASINGTLREQSVCHQCGEAGHRIHNCPNRSGAQWAPANVRCQWCGADTHVSNDCRNRGPGAQPIQQKLDSEYANFMNELTGEETLTEGGARGPIAALPAGAGAGGDNRDNRGGGGGGGGGNMGHLHPSRQQHFDPQHMPPPPPPSAYHNQPPPMGRPPYGMMPPPPFGMMPPPQFGGMPPPPPFGMMPPPPNWGQYPPQQFQGGGGGGGGGGSDYPPPPPPPPPPSGGNPYDQQSHHYPPPPPPQQ